MLPTSLGLSKQNYYSSQYPSCIFTGGIVFLTRKPKSLPVSLLHLYPLWFEAIHSMSQHSLGSPHEPDNLLGSREIEMTKSETSLPGSFKMTLSPPSKMTSNTFHLDFTPTTSVKILVASLLCHHSNSLLWLPAQSSITSLVTFPYVNVFMFILKKIPQTLRKTKRMLYKLGLAYPYYVCPNLHAILKLFLSTHSCRY